MSKGDFFLAYTSQNTQLSKFNIIDNEGNILYHVDYEKSGLNNIDKVNDLFYVAYSSRNNEIIMLDEKLEHESYKIKNQFSITEAYSEFDKYIATLNGGTYTRSDGKTSYNSGVLIIDSKKEIKEKKFDIGYFGTIQMDVNERIYLINHDIAEDKYQLVILNGKLEIEKILDLKNDVNIYNSMAVINENIFIQTNNSSILKINISDYSIKEIKLNDFYSNALGKPMGILKNSSKVVMLYSNTIFVFNQDGENLRQLSLEKDKLDRELFICSKAIDEEYMYINYRFESNIEDVLDDSNKYDGVIKKYDLESGSLLKSIFIPYESYYLIYNDFELIN